MHTAPTSTSAAISLYLSFCNRNPSLSLIRFKKTREWQHSFSRRNAKFACEYYYYIFVEKAQNPV